MSRFTRYLMLLVAVSLLVATGCGEKTEPPRDDQAAANAADEIARLQAELDRARGDRAGLEDEILRLRDERDKAQARANELESAKGPQWTNVPGGQMTSIEGTLLFDSGDAKLRPGAKDVLRQVADDIRGGFPDYDIYVFGHTDNEPIKVSGWDDNYELSCQRALSVVRHLQSLGCQKNMLAGGWSENVPVASNTTAAGKQQNRRVEIYAIMTKAAMGEK